MGGTTKVAATAGDGKSGEALPPPVAVDLRELAAAVLADSMFIGLVRDGLREILDEPVARLEAQLKMFTDAIGSDPETIAKALSTDAIAVEVLPNLLAHEDFVAGVGNLITARLATDDFAGQLVVPISEYLDKQLPELVAAAMPDTPEKAAARRVEEAQAAQDRQQRADRRAAREREREAEKVAEERAGRKAEARDRRTALTTLPEDETELALYRVAVDLATVARGSLLLDDGTVLSIDFARDVAASELRPVEGSNGLLLKAAAIDIGQGMPEPFRIEAALLVLECGEGHRVLRCPMQSPLTVGGGAVAQLGAESLLFRPI
ncbi:hypothetical protein M9978_08310 [Sphingomonas sp. MG17]|uniref:Uncharacterized protein n=1 Tax=Sphingomonas tagetis TaxID=2949092 RepID=A0A9X2HPZ0_9SPHN|nr:hypothetical protein [Sphingomonas tagetis]MCP3730430.1 hypothetical protein [Sphingomonas tagetis]